MARAGRNALIGRGPVAGIDAHALSMRLCAWEPISTGRMKGRIGVTHVRGALIDLGMTPTDELLGAIYGAWFGKWRIDATMVDGAEIHEVVHDAPEATARALNRRKSSRT